MSTRPVTIRTAAVAFRTALTAGRIVKSTAEGRSVLLRGRREEQTQVLAQEIHVGVFDDARVVVPADPAFPVDEDELEAVGRRDALHVRQQQRQRRLLDLRRVTRQE